MSRNVLKDTTRAATSAVKTFKRSDPILVRKKMEMKDVYYRKNEPEREVMRFELAFDVEEYFILVAGACLLVFLGCKIYKCACRHAMRKAEKRKKQGN